jgi:hypothetical protein
MKNSTIYTGIGGGDCGFYFKKGLEYILYASKQNLDFSKKFNAENFNKSFWTDICTRTQKTNLDEIKRICKFRKKNDRQQIVCIRAGLGLKKKPRLAILRSEGTFSFSH